MKKAYIEQFLLGFLLVFATLTFVATSADEYSTRNKLYDLKNIAMQTGKAMAKSYEQNMDMCYSKTIAENILRQSALGSQLLELKANGGITFDYDFYDHTGTGGNPDGQPDQVQVSINGYSYETFWYKFFDKDNFTFNAISENFNVDTPKTVTIRYGDRPSASYQNIFGTYQLDSNNCITNVKMHMANSKDWDKWEEEDSDGLRIPIADGIESPPTYVFAIADGNRKYNNPSDNAPIELSGNHCFESSSYPELTINNITNQATVGNASTGNPFFQHKELNPDKHEHFHIIPSSIFDDYIYFKNHIYSSSGNEKDKYEAFKNYADSLNADGDPANDIDYINDPNDEYKYALEDLDANQSDMDFTDMLLDSERLVIPNETDEYTVDSDQKIVFNDGYCEGDIENIPPTLTIEGCPLQTLEDTPTSLIRWIAADSDGTITSKEASTNNGSATINENGTITYTPDLNFYGEDTITIVVKDDEDAVAKKECHVTITEVNDAPTISGSPLTSVEIGNSYIFTPSAEDVDGDVLTFNIENKPPWLMFNSSTGQLSGTPSISDGGIYSNIIIKVNDGRGGKAQLPTFSIEVTGGNNAPIIESPIPDQTVQEKNTYSYNVSSHFSDPDGDPLTYTINALLNGNPIGGFTIGNDGQISSITIPIGYVGSILTITVTASDGTQSVSDTFNVTITNHSDVQIFYHTFERDTQGWGGYSSWEKHDNDGKLKITANQTFKNRNVRYTFNFGAEYANKNVNVEFDFYHSGGWESSGSNEDKFIVKLNGNKKADDRYGNGSNGTYGPIPYNITAGKTDSDGMIEVRLIINVTDTNETAYIDNVRVSLQ